jgi:hypothetical protein
MALGYILKLPPIIPRAQAKATDAPTAAFTILLSQLFSFLEGVGDLSDDAQITGRMRCPSLWRV